jgi:hypothetical protein
MKKIMIMVVTIGLLVACGSGDKKNKNSGDMDSTKKDTTGTATNDQNNSGTRDFKFYADKFKTPDIDGIQLQQKKLTDHSQDLEIHISNYVTNAKEAGFDELTFSTVNPQLYSGEQMEKYNGFNKENFEYFQNLDPNLPKITATEYKTGDLTFFYCIRKNNKGFMGGKDYHGLVLEAKSGDLILSMYITVFDLKSDMKKAEEGAKKVADWVAQ